MFFYQANYLRRFNGHHAVAKSADNFTGVEPGAASFYEVVNMLHLLGIKGSVINLRKLTEDAIGGYIVHRIAIHQGSQSHCSHFAFVVGEERIKPFLSTVMF